MSKEKTTKKKNLKLRRQIRKTVGALFMVSAIVVAAIPVPDIEAEALKVDSVSDTRDTLDYENNIGDDLNLGGTGLLDQGNDTTDKVSYVVRELSNGSWSLNWQFKYYLVPIEGSERAIISKYNDIYPEAEVVLSNSANAGYYIVTNDQYNTFYSTGAGNVTHTFSYTDYKNSLAAMPTSDMEWIKKYRKTYYDNFVATCEAYYQYEQDLQQYQIDKQIYDDYVAAGEDLSAEDAPKNPTPPTEPTRPTQISFNPKTDFTNEERYSYYCDFDPNLENQNYTLVPVTDNRPSSGGSSGSGIANTVFLARGGSPVPPAYNDANGFLVTEASTEIIGIGNNAFASISNVDTLDLPNELKYIGDGAFKGSFIKSINMANVENIGNHAFEDCTELANATMRSTKRIGVESFRNSGITSATFPYSLSEIGTG